MIQERMMRDNNTFRLLSYNNEGMPGIRPSQGSSKFLRFLQVQPLFATGKIKFPDVPNTDPFFHELYNELKNISQTNTGRRIGSAARDDLADSIGQISMLSIVVPSKESFNDVKSKKEQKEIAKFEEKAKEKATFESIYGFDEVDDMDTPYDDYL